MSYAPFDGHQPSDPQAPTQLRIIWRMQGPQSVVVAAIYAHPTGRELRVYFERSEDAIHTEVGEVEALDAKAAQLRAVMLEQGWMPIQHEPPRVQ
jgi:hypothetical protein